ncbi:hypothetical protein CDD82_4537 [Ophiocordyceps australis]|uniref:Uncharacterized protein n=1 Tax=Ophiocordyceps australis TaxID=1399860 RepID=A0A2C5Z5C9_9HYPO|nr:hypothetical protein CDD82_4537 [Ophiocordyceps australis]
MRKLLGKPATPSSAGGQVPSSAGDATPTSTAWRPAQAQDAVYNAGAPIGCFDVAPDRRVAVLAGPHVLKTVLLNGDSTAFSPSEGINLRAALAMRQSGFAADQLNIGHVKWYKDATVFTACASGKIFTYDVTRLGPAFSGPLECIQTQEDSRQVNSLDVNPHRPSWLLSGSQDGWTRIFNASQPHPNTRSGALAFRQQFAPLRCIDSVRQVQWSPTNGTELACCTESGVVLKWDVKQPSRPLLRINAHDKACAAIAWHPDGIHLISAGWDAKLHVWDLGATADKRQRPKWALSMPAPVSAVAWRPATTHTRRVAQVAVSYEESGTRRYGIPAVHVWDLARPTMPYKQIERFDKAPSALMWQGQDMLWTVGQDGLFNQCDVAFAPKVLDRQSTSAMAFSPRGDAMVFLDERSQPQRSRHAVSHGTEPVTDAVHHKTEYSPSQNMTGLSVSRSDSEEDAMATFVASQAKTLHKRLPSGRSGLLMSTTPPSGPPPVDDGLHAINLEQSIAVTGLFTPQQAMVSGHVPWTKSVQLYEYMSSAYLEILHEHLPWTDGGKPLVERVANIMEEYARTAQGANLFRLAQTWRILAYAVTLLLRRRGQYHVESRAGQAHKLPRVESSSNVRARTSEASTSGVGDSAATGEATPRPPSLAHRTSIEGRLAARSLLAEELESTSNVPTPIARPVDSSAGIDGTYQYGRRLKRIVEPESLSLGPAAHGSFGQGRADAGHGDSNHGPDGSSDGRSLSQVSSTEGYDFYDTEVLAKAIDVPRPRLGGASGPQKRAWHRRKSKQESDDTYGQMFSFSEGNKLSGLRSSSSDDAFAKPTMTRQLSDTDKSSISSSVDEKHGLGHMEEMEGQQEGGTGAHTSTDASRAQQDEALGAQMTNQSDDSSQVEAASEASEAEQGGEPRMSETAARGESGRVASTGKSAAKPRFHVRPQIVENDYLPWEGDAPWPYPLQTDAPPVVGSAGPPLDPYTVVRRALDFEVKTSALHASAMVLLLRPLVPSWVIGVDQASGILRQHHGRLMAMSLFVPAALLRKLCVAGYPAGMPSWGDTHVSIVAPAQLNTKVGLACPACRKPREPDPRRGANAIWRCEHCAAVMAPCAVCAHREARLELAAWWACAVCGHGGHAACLTAWHAESLGACPQDGCGHVCLEEHGRDEGEGEGGTHSRAVGQARGALGEQRKSVKFARPSCRE